MTDDILVQKYERYFRDPIIGDGVLRKGAVGIVCNNIRRAIDMLGGRISDVENDVFDEHLEAAVRSFQRQHHHRVADGAVGPGTRALLAKLLLARFEPDIFLRLVHPEGSSPPTVFISYAWRDSDRVDKIDQWLRDHGVRVLRDRNWFVAGTLIPDNIRNAIVLADKVVAVYSENSRDRDWPRVEIAVAEQFEQRAGYQVLIYLNLDGTQLPTHDPHRIAIIAPGSPLRQVGNELLQAVLGRKAEPPRYDYNEDECI